MEWLLLAITGCCGGAWHWLDRGSRVRGKDELDQIMEKRVLDIFGGRNQASADVIVLPPACKRCGCRTKPLGAVPKAFKPGQRSFKCVSCETIRMIDIGKSAA